ncbi:hypothetical protein [Blastopirellula marina]|uniref:Carboxypeptidase regulatory-like domain-containing protein n=1 Tax=Blastopirellula marina DSM 3645 TaxID=314230 RepID=A3ZXG7_9BACT|nr:hypothetical protein [Blastopirellula marina]EAQ78757.1 hypothetical protein DSM3645_29686 [Blastopirellula marina DSM 3645]
MRKQFPLFSLVVLVGLWTFFLGGCANEAGLERRIVAGRVTYQGKPIESGEIRFVPTSKGPVSAALIRNGDYEVTHRGGVMLGNAKVEIVITSNAAPVSIEELDNHQSPPSGGVLPKKYGAESTLRVDVQQGPGKQTLDFDLTKKSAAATPASICPAARLANLC